MRRVTAAIGACGMAMLAVIGYTTPASAREPTSLYTTIDLDTCRVTRRHRDGNTWSCNGLPGYPVMYAEGDLRAFVSVGGTPGKRQAAEQTLGPFNSIFIGRSRRATIEWRVHSQDGKAIPHATILRYYTRNDTGQGEVLVIMKVTERDTCQAALIDALAESEAVAMARQIADGAARTFDCKDEPVTHGKSGKSPF